MRRGTDTVTRTEFVYSLTGDLGWFEPEGAEEALERGIEEDLLEGREGLCPGFDVGTVEIPEGFSPDTDAIKNTSTSTSMSTSTSESASVEGTEKRGVFERAVERLVGAGYEKREAVAEINRRHTEMGDVRVEAAALLVAKEEGLRVSDLAEDALEDLRR